MTGAFTRSVVAATALLAVTAAPLSAKPLSPDAALQWGTDATPDKTQALFGAVTAGSMKIDMEKTTLDDVEKAFGGKMQDEGDAGDSSYWVCYAGPDAGGAPSLFWFTSGEMGGSDHGILTVAQQPNPGAKTPEGCSPAPAALTGIDFGVPAIGVALGDVTAKFGNAKPDRHGQFNYSASFPAVDPALKDFVTQRSLGYSAKDGKIAGIVISQNTVN